MSRAKLRLYIAGPMTGLPDSPTPHCGGTWPGWMRLAQRQGLIRRSTTLFRRSYGHGAPTLGWERA